MAATWGTRCALYTKMRYKIRQFSILAHGGKETLTIKSASIPFEWPVIYFTGSFRDPGKLALFKLVISNGALTRATLKNIQEKIYIAINRLKFWEILRCLLLIEWHPAALSDETGNSAHDNLGYERDGNVNSCDRRAWAWITGYSFTFTEHHEAICDWMTWGRSDLMNKGMTKRWEAYWVYILGEW